MTHTRDQYERLVQIAMSDNQSEAERAVVRLIADIAFNLQTIAEHVTTRATLTPRAPEPPAH